MSKFTLDQMVQLAKQSIVNLDNDLRDKVLEKIPFEKLPKQIVDNIIYDLIDLTRSTNDESSTKKIIYEAQRNYIGNLDFRYTLLMNNFFKPVQLAHIAESLGMTYFDSVNEIIMSGYSGPAVYTAMKNLDSLFIESEDLTKLEILLKQSEDTNIDVYNYIIEKIREVGDFSQIPDYIIETDLTEQQLDKIAEESIDNLKSLIFKDFEIPTDEEIISRVSISLAIDRTDLENIDISDQITEMSDREKKDLIEPYVRLDRLNLLVDSSDMDELTRIYGPENRFIDLQMEEYLDNKSRMFTCKAYDYDNYNNYYTDWFLGSCDFCPKRIEKRWYAIRRPMEFGGWEGCYCSWDCLSESLFEVDYSPVVEKLIEIYKRQMSELGIYDRN